MKYQRITNKQRKAIERRERKYLVAHHVLLNGSMVKTIIPNRGTLICDYRGHVYEMQPQGNIVRVEEAA